jgi:hypothetical protein
LRKQLSNRKLEEALMEREQQNILRGLHEKGNDMVNHPKHYTSDPSGVECIDITRHRNFNIGNAIKYLWRAGLKDEKKTVEDLKKAIFYISDEINRLESK